MRPIVGRRRELEATRAFLDSLATEPGHLVLEGPAGIGKSAIWTAAVDAARDRSSTVLSTRPAAADSSLAWSGLADLLGPVVRPAIEGLPDPQRRALEIALSMRDPEASPVDDLSVRLAAQAVLQAAAAQRRLILAVDDLQWLDAPSAGVLAFVLRRLQPGSVALLATLRSADADPLAGVRGTPVAAVADDLAAGILEAIRDHRVSVRVGPLDADAVRELVRDAVDAPLGRGALDEIVRSSGGNPLYALELARSGPAGHGPLVAVIERRVRSLPTGVQELLAIVATAGPLGWEDAQLLASDDVRLSDLDAAQSAGFITVSGGTMSFTHPLLASTVAAATSEPRRRSINRRFAELWPDREDAARHLALAGGDPDAAVAERLAAAADVTRRRGAPAYAAELYEAAAARTPAEDEDALAARRIEAALAHVAAANAPRARELLELVASRPDGPRRAEALHRLAGVAWAADGDKAGLEAFHRALPAAAGDAALEGDIHDTLAWLTCWLGDMPGAFEHARIARGLAEQVGDPALLSRVFDKYAQIEFQIAMGPGLGASAKAVEYELAAGAVGEAAQNEALILVCSDRLDEARERLLDNLRHAEATGNERFRIDVLASLCAVETRAGAWAQARAYARESFDAAAAAGLATGPQRRALALLDALGGQSEATLAAVAELLPAMRAEGAAWAIIRLLGMAGIAHLSVGDVEAAAVSLDEAVTVSDRIGIREPGIFRIAADAIEALVGAGRLDRAEEVLDELEAQSRAVERRWGLATAARARGLLRAAQGQIDEALAAAREGVTLTSELGQPFEHARALLVAGTIERRAGSRREARERLSEARAMFERLGAESWAARAATEAARISGRVAAGSELTATEDRVAALVGEGLTNQEVADRLFVTVRTVEANLTRIYGKLGVRSRTELARRLAEGRGSIAAAT